jgi:DNA-binding CsgD family transcriptional regulator
MNRCELTPRQARIVALIARGLPDKEIAAVLGITEETVATHLKRLYVRWGVHARSALVHHWLNSTQPPGVPRTWD